MFRMSVEPSPFLVTDHVDDVPDAGGARVPTTFSSMILTPFCQHRSVYDWGRASVDFV